MCTGADGIRIRGSAEAENEKVTSKNLFGKIKSRVNRE